MAQIPRVGSKFPRIYGSKNMFVGVSCEGKLIFMSSTSLCNICIVGLLFCCHCHCCYCCLFIFLIVVIVVIVVT